MADEGRREGVGRSGKRGAQDGSGASKKRIAQNRGCRIRPSAKNKKPSFWYIEYTSWVLVESFKNAAFTPAFASCFLSATSRDVGVRIYARPYPTTPLTSGRARRFRAMCVRKQGGSTLFAKRASDHKPKSRPFTYASSALGLTNKKSRNYTQGFVTLRLVCDDAPAGKVPLQLAHDGILPMHQFSSPPFVARQTAPFSSLQSAKLAPLLLTTAHVSWLAVVLLKFSSTWLLGHRYQHFSLTWHLLHRLITIPRRSFATRGAGIRLGTGLEAKKALLCDDDFLWVKRQMAKRLVI
eukprot:2806949-Rhodomonas_salina.2